MITFIAVLLVICCGLVIFVGLSINSLQSQLKDVGYNVTRIKGAVSDIYTQQPYNSWFTSTYETLNKKLDVINDHLTTEIACLATKNNEDIKRMKGDYQQWDMIEYEGSCWIIYKVDRHESAGLVSYSVYNCFGELRIFNDKELAHSTFIKHAGSQFDEQK